VRPLYFVFSSSSRAPSLAATAPGTGHCKREIQGDRGRVDRNREKKKSSRRTDKRGRRRKGEKNIGEEKQRTESILREPKGEGTKKKEKQRRTDTPNREKENTQKQGISGSRCAVAIPLRSFISRAISGEVSFPLPFHSFSIFSVFSTVRR